MSFDPTFRKEPGLGSKKGRTDSCMTRIVVSFDDDTFAEIRHRAIWQGRSFGQMVRELVEWGLEADEDVK